MSNLMAFIILFGILVFVHELGHFLMAKYFKIGVEKFALGFGPKLFGKKVGETEYLIAAIPLGGYVKMIGDEPSEALKAAQNNTALPGNSFLAKPPWQRILVVLMGPIANLLLPVGLFFIVYMVGMPYLTNEVGYVSHKSVADIAGIKPGDKITAVNGKTTVKWDELVKSIQERPKLPTELTVVRADSSTPMVIKLIPKEEESPIPLGDSNKVGTIGVSPQSFTLSVRIPTADSLAYKQGVRDEDRLTQVNGKPVRFVWQIMQAIEASPSNIVKLSFTRGLPTTNQNNAIQLELPRSLIVNAKHELNFGAVGVYLQELMIERVLPSSIADEKGLKRGDILYAINKHPLASWFSFQELIRANQGESLMLTLVRDGKPIELEISPRMTEQKEELTGEKIRQRILGVTSMGELYNQNVAKERILNPIKALAKSASQCYEIAALTVIGFGKLIAGQISAKTLGGPILIFQLAGKSWRSGIYDFINMLVLISISLGVLNLLPIPVLDGGHLMFYTIELVKGSPIQARTRELAQQAGVIILIGIMLFAFYNDLGRISWDELGWVHWLKQLFS